MSELIFELSDTELDAVAAGNGYPPGGMPPGQRKKLDVNVVVVVADQTATSTATATSGSITIKNTHGPLETGPGDLNIYTGDATATATSSNTLTAG